MRLLPAAGGLFLAVAILATWVWVGILESEVEIISGRQQQVIAMVSAMSKDHARRLAWLEATIGQPGEEEHPSAQPGNPLAYHVIPGSAAGINTERISLLEDRMTTADIDRAQLAAQVRDISAAVRALQERVERPESGASFHIAPDATFDGPGNPGTKRPEPMP